MQSFFFVFFLLLLFSIVSSRSLSPLSPFGQMGEMNVEEGEWMIPSMAKRVPSAGDMMVRFG